MFRSNYATLIAIIAMTVVATAAWLNIGYRLTRIESKMNGVIYADDLDRFGVQLQLRNEAQHLNVPSAYEIMRRQETYDPPPVRTPSPIAHAQ